MSIVNMFQYRFTLSSILYVFMFLTYVVSLDSSTYLYNLPVSQSPALLPSLFSIIVGLLRLSSQLNQTGSEQ